MKKLVIMLIMLLSVSINAFEISENGDIKIKGLLLVKWVEMEENIKPELYLIPEDSEKFSGKPIIIETEDRDKTENLRDKERKIMEIFKKIPDKNDEILTQPVILTLKPIKYTEWADYGEIYSTMKKFEKIDKTTAVYKYNDFSDFFQLVFEMAPNYKIYSKEGYSNLREKPNANSKVIQKLKNGQRVVKIFETGNWIYAYVFLTLDNVKQNEMEGYIHKSQLK